MKRILSSLFILSAIIGCGPDRPPMGQVTGTVQYNGSPIQEGTIIFEVPGNRTATGKITAGAITDVTSWEPNDGVPVGVARIAVQAIDSGATATAVSDPSNPSASPAKLPDNYMGMNASSLVPEKYQDPSTSELTFEIKPGQNVVDLNLKD